MAEFPYTTVPGKLGSLLDKIRHTGVPQKATVAWLKSLGFTSSNDATVLPILKFIGLCDPSGVPTDEWKHYRGGQHGAVLAGCIQNGYSELFAIYPSAHQQSDGDLTSFFTTRSSAGKQVISKTVTTFKTLCAKADFSASPTHHAPTQTPHAPTAPAAAPVVSHSPVAPVTSSPHPEVHIDIQIHISPEATPTQIDQIFQSMSKHLYGRDSK